VFLKRLAKAYPNQARNLTGGPIHIRVDDRDNKDSYPGFCDIHLKMSDPEADEFTLILDNIPFDDEVKAVATALNGIWQSTRTGERLTLNLSASFSDDIGKLAKVTRNVVGRGRKYLDPNWKWIARRTAISLERLAGTLS
jgi:hypothetical protein